MTFCFVGFFASLFPPAIILFGTCLFVVLDVDISFLGFLCSSVPFTEYTLSGAFVKKDIFLTTMSVSFLHELSAVLSLCLVVELPKFRFILKYHFFSINIER